jgi:hypothetical protein
MKDEIKEIYLSNLEWTKTHDNMGGVMGNIVFKDNMSYEKYQNLLKSGYFGLCDKDYITNLEQENEKKDKIIEKTRKMLHKRLLDDYDTYTANVVCDFQSDFEEIIRLTGGDEE